MKRVLITAGSVYGPLDANKLVGNRVWGVWALRFKKVKAERDSLLLMVKPRTPGFMKNRDQSDEG